MPYKNASDHIANNRKWQVAHPEKVREYQRRYKVRHPEHRNSTEYMRTYMRHYREAHRERIREIVRIEQARRDRELTTDVVLNKHFEGAHLHHLSPSVAIYIPEGLHTSIPHNLKTGRGMDKINEKVLEWLKGGFI